MLGIVRGRRLMRCDESDEGEEARKDVRWEQGFIHHGSRPGCVYLDGNFSTINLAYVPQSSTTDVRLPPTKAPDFLCATEYRTPTYLRHVVEINFLICVPQTSISKPPKIQQFCLTLARYSELLPPQSPCENLNRACEGHPGTHCSLTPRSGSSPCIRECAENPDSCMRTWPSRCPSRGYQTETRAKGLQG